MLQIMRRFGDIRRDSNAIQNREHPAGSPPATPHRFRQHRSARGGVVCSHVYDVAGTSPIALRSLEPAHLTAGASLHAGAEEPEPDMNAFLYSTNRLPAGIVHVNHVILGQTAKSFINAGFHQVSEWQPVSSPGRRRRWYWDGGEMLAAYIASSSDLDDLIPSLVAYESGGTDDRLLRDHRETHKQLLESEGDIEDRIGTIYSQGDLMSRTGSV